MAKILMVNVPYTGHVNPTLPLASSLVARGHEVAYINAPEWREKIEETGASFIPYLDYPEGLSEQAKKRKCFLAAGQTVMAVGHRYDLLLYEMFFFPAKALAEQLGIPAVRQFSQPAWSRETVRYAQSSSKLWRLSCRFLSAQIFTKDTAARLNMENKTLVESVVSEIPELNIVYVPGEFQPLREKFDERFLFIGPSIPLRASRALSFDYGAMKRPLIYISLGSIMSSPSFCKECFRAFGGKDLTVIMSTGRVNLSTLGAIPENFFAMPYAPQLEALEHADLFITHGGMNSVNEAMYYGVPMLVMPVLNDQPINALQVVRLGIGRKIRPFFTSGNMLYRNAMSVIDNKSIREKARSLPQRLASGPALEDAVDALEKLLAKRHGA